MEAIEFFPSVMGLTYEDIYMDTEDGLRLNAWFIPAKDSKFTILFCHGNGGNISHRIDKIEILNKLGLNVFIFDYRGYGKSNGRPSERGLYKDALASYEYLVSKKGISKEHIIVYGESLGGAVAVNLVSKKNARALITESAFSSARDVARAVYPLFPVFLMSSKFDSSKKIKDINIPKLIIHSKNDDIVPFDQSVKLFNSSKEPKKHVVLMGAHNSSYMDSLDLYTSSIHDFVNEL